MDPFEENISAVRNLIESPINKTMDVDEPEEGVESEEIDLLELSMDDDELLSLKEAWQNRSDGYLPKIKARQELNKTYYAGRQELSTSQNTKVVASNLLFEAEETFIPQALSQNPEPVVWSDNTDEGKLASNDVKTMLQYHADVLCLRKKLGVMVRHWSIYFTGVLKHGWDAKSSDIKCEVRKPQNFILDPDGYIDEYGNFVGDFLGERVTTTARKLIDLFPSEKEYITTKVDNKLGTTVSYTEWWTDEFCFSTFGDIVLDKHKNEFFKYEDGALNHFAIPKMPYTFLSVFSLQEQPYDITNLIEQNIPNQDRITNRDSEIDKNLKTATNSVVLSGISFTAETAGQARDTFYEEGFLLVPDGNVEGAVKRLPASPLPSGLLEVQSAEKDTLRSIFGTQGLAAQPQNEDSTARGMILNQSHDSSRIGGGIGDSLEQVADNVFNWWLQLYRVFYDEPHYASIMGNGRAVEYATIVNTNLNRHFVVSVAPNSMAPKDELTEQNQAIQLAEGGWLDPLTLFKKLNYPDPTATAKAVTLFRANPQAYMQTYFPEAAAPQGAPPPPGQGTPEVPGSPPQPLSQEPASASLSQVPLPK